MVRYHPARPVAQQNVETRRVTGRRFGIQIRIGSQSRLWVVDLEGGKRRLAFPHIWYQLL